MTIGWDRPDSAAPGVYLIERREQPEGGDFRPWQQIHTTVERNSVVTSQLRERRDIKTRRAASAALFFIPLV